MNWIKTYKDFNIKRTGASYRTGGEHEENKDIKNMVGECVFRFSELFNLINSDLVEKVDLKSDNEYEDEYAPAIMFKNGIQSKCVPELKIMLQDNIFTILSRSIGNGIATKAEFVRDNGVKAQNKFVAFTDNHSFKISVLNPSRRVCPCPKTKEEILYEMILNYAKLIETWEKEFIHIKYLAAVGGDKIIKTVTYKQILLNYCYYLVENYKNGMDLFKVQQNELLDNLCHIVCNELGRIQTGYKTINNIERLYPKFYDKLKIICGEDKITKASDLGTMGFND